MTITEDLEDLKKLLDSGGSMCIHCGIPFSTIRECRKHLLAEHYDYCLAQCYGDKELLKEWANLP